MRNLLVFTLVLGACGDDPKPVCDIAAGTMSGTVHDTAFTLVSGSAMLGHLDPSRMSIAFFAEDLISDPSTCSFDGARHDSTAPYAIAAFVGDTLAVSSEPARVDLHFCVVNGNSTNCGSNHRGLVRVDTIDAGVVTGGACGSGDGHEINGTFSVVHCQ